MGEGRSTRPQMGSVVTIKTKSVLLDETEVDVHDSYTFVLGDGDVLQGTFLKKTLRKHAHVIYRYFLSCNS